MTNTSSPNNIRVRFFGASLAASSTSAGVDTLILTGVTTSGCVRATCVDSVRHGFITLVAREAVGDGDPHPHEANFYDMSAKYADVSQSRKSPNISRPTRIGARDKPTPDRGSIEEQGRETIVECWSQGFLHQRARCAMSNQDTNRGAGCMARRPRDQLRSAHHRFDVSVRRSSFCRDGFQSQDNSRNDTRFVLDMRRDGDIVE